MRDVTHPEVMTMRRYADYDPDAARDGQTLAVPPARPRRTTIDKIHEAVEERRFRVLQREPDGSWTLRWLDDATGVIGEPDHTSEPFAGGPSGPYGEAFDAAAAWALDIVDVESWQALTDGNITTGFTVFIDSLHNLIADIARRGRTGCALVVRIEDDPYMPDLRLVKAREKWTASGRVSSALATYEVGIFRDVEQVLDWASERFGVDRAGWRTVTEGSEYQHD